MSRKPDKAARRKAKLKARKAHAERHRLHLSGRIADALMDVSFPKRSYCMATIIRKEERDFQPHPGRMDGWRLMTDMSRQRRGLNPQYLNFDMRELPPQNIMLRITSTVLPRSCF